MVVHGRLRSCPDLQRLFSAVQTPKGAAKVHGLRTVLGKCRNLAVSCKVWARRSQMMALDISAAKTLSCLTQTGLALPSDLLLDQIFALLDFRDKVNAERVCKAWNKLLRQPRSRVWGSVRINLSRFAAQPAQPTPRSVQGFAQLCSSIRRWVTDMLASRTAASDCFAMGRSG